VSLIFFDDALARDFEPFALTRPACELRLGAEVLRRRWEIALDDTTHGIVAADHLADFDEPGAPAILRDDIPAGSVLVNSRCAISLDARSVPGDAAVWRCQGRVAAVRVRDAIPRESLEAADSLDAIAAGAAVDVEGWWVEAVWDVVQHLGAMLGSDIPALAARLDLEPATALAPLGAHQVYLEPDVRIEPYVVLDASAGPILVRRGAALRAFTRLAGPCVIGERSVVKGGIVTGSSIGEDCRVHGEVSTTVFTGHANKAHDGFIGHSVLGRWVNLGASTVNSNLKNTYGRVSLWTPHGMRETGLQFLGTMFGDHAKTAIGTRLTTGCVIGAGANVFGGETTPKMVPPFAWGTETGETFALEGFLRSAERMMARRHVVLSDRTRRQLTAAYARRLRTD
jgi:UDP-N-acetylglucosamine diphosphorylase/glucosamine-1-phosphate N-acetyltransferase